jgi:hypothetical protein
VQVGIFRALGAIFRCGVIVVSLVIPMTGRATDKVDRSPDSNSPLPRCGPPMDGQVSCKFGVIYECRLIDPNSMERRTGWRWTADLLRGCPREVPVAADQPIALPPVVTYVPETGVSEFGDGPCQRPVQNGAGKSAKNDGTASVGMMRVRPGRNVPRDGTDAAGCR